MNKLPQDSSLTHPFLFDARAVPCLTPAKHWSSFKDYISRESNDFLRDFKTDGATRKAPGITEFELFTCVVPTTLSENRTCFTSPGERKKAFTKLGITDGKVCGRLKWVHNHKNSQLFFPQIIEALSVDDKGFCIKGVHDLVIEGLGSLCQTIKAPHHLTDTHAKPFPSLNDRKPDGVLSLDMVASNVLSHLVYIEVKSGIKETFSNDDLGECGWLLACSM